MAAGTMTGFVCSATTTTTLFALSVTFQSSRQPLPPHDQGPKQLPPAVPAHAQPPPFTYFSPTQHQLAEKRAGVSPGGAADGELGTLGGPELARSM